MSLRSSPLDYAAWGESAAGDHRLNVERRSRELFHKLFMRGRLRSMWAGMSRTSNRLMDLASVAATGKVVGQHYRGIRTVPVELICGSEGRCDDFDASFRPLQSHGAARWISVATAFQLGVSLPPVELIAVGDIYFVRDGHHRISVARVFGQGYIDAVVTVWSV